MSSKCLEYARLDPSSVFYVVPMRLMISPGIETTPATLGRGGSNAACLGARGSGGDSAHPAPLGCRGRCSWCERVQFPGRHRVITQLPVVQASGCLFVSALALPSCAPIRPMGRRQLLCGNERQNSPAASKTNLRRRVHSAPAALLVRFQGGYLALFRPIHTLSRRRLSHSINWRAPPSPLVQLCSTTNQGNPNRCHRGVHNDNFVECVAQVFYCSSLIRLERANRSELPEGSSAGSL